MSEDQWYYAVDGQQLGPVPVGTLRQLVSTQQIDRDTLVWKDGMAEWTPAGDVQGLLGAAPVQSRGRSPSRSKTRITRVMSSHDVQDWKAAARKGTPGLAIAAAVFDFINGLIAGALGALWIAASNQAADAEVDQEVVDGLHYLGTGSLIFGVCWIAIGICLLTGWRASRPVQMIASIALALVGAAFLMQIPDAEEAQGLKIIFIVYIVMTLLPMFMVMPHSVAEHFLAGGTSRRGPYSRRRPRTRSRR